MQNYYYQPGINDTYLNRLQRLNQIQNQFNNQYPQYNNPLPLNNQIILYQDNRFKRIPNYKKIHISRTTKPRTTKARTTKKTMFLQLSK